MDLLSISEGDQLTEGVNHQTLKVVDYFPPEGPWREAKARHVLKQIELGRQEMLERGEDDKLV